jgi:phosphoribosylaminoimidazolecarboxamide formyltransferase/IMP cyclohydrolase
MNLNVVRRIDDRVPIRRALVSVSDKTNLEFLARGLLAACPDVVFYSTGGTHAALAGLFGLDTRRHLVAVSDYTGQPEMQGGLVKTLDFKIYLGLLSEPYNEAHDADLARCGAVRFDLVVVNLYPFVQTVQKPGCTPEVARGHIDIGGPCMLRAAAKNYIRVACLTDPADYEGFLRETIQNGGAVSFSLRFRLAQKAFEHVAAYDQAIARYLSGLSVEDARRVYTFEESGGRDV